MNAKFFFREVNNGCNNKQRMKGIPVNPYQPDPERSHTNLSPFAKARVGCERKSGIEIRVYVPP